MYCIVGNRYLGHYTCPHDKDTWQRYQKAFVSMTWTYDQYQYLSLIRSEQPRQRFTDWPLTQVNSCLAPEVALTSTQNPSKHSRKFAAGNRTHAWPSRPFGLHSEFYKLSNQSWSSADMRRLTSVDSELLAIQTAIARSKRDRGFFGSHIIVIPVWTYAPGQRAIYIRLKKYDRRCTSWSRKECRWVTERTYGDIYVIMITR